VSYRPSSFVLQELVDPSIHAARGEAAWQLLDVRAVQTLQALRDKFGSCTVNNWHIGGTYRESGLRNPTTATGAKYSQHKFGRAFDCKFKDATPREVAAYVQANPTQFPSLTVIEDPQFTPTWFHFDVRLHDRSGIWMVKP
jgi:hypothetical protein